MKQRWFELAAKAAGYSTHDTFKMGAILLQKNKVISFGCNNPNKTHTKGTDAWNTVHAELDAIIGVKQSLLTGGVICVVRVNKAGAFRSSKPCVGCTKLLTFSGIEKVYYITDGGEQAVLRL